MIIKLQLNRRCGCICLICGFICDVLEGVSEQISNADVVNFYDNADYLVPQQRLSLTSEVK